MVLPGLSQSFEESRHRLPPGTRVDIVRRKDNEVVCEYVPIVRWDPFTSKVRIKTNEGEEKDFSFRGYRVNPVIRG